MKRLKVLVSAYACSPYKGSEPGVGWGFVTELSKYHDLWVIVEEEKFRSDIEKFQSLNSSQPSSVHFYFIHKIPYNLSILYTKIFALKEKNGRSEKSFKIFHIFYNISNHIVLYIVIFRFSSKNT